LVCAAIPAAERWYVLSRREILPRERLALLEGLVTLWRVILCAVAVWAALSAPEWLQLRQHLGTVASWELALQHIGGHLGHRLRVVLWEYVLFLAAFWLLNETVARAVKKLAASSRGWLNRKENCRATISVLRNLVLVPLAVIYLVETVRPMFR
jgi:hypothetical protein